MTVLPTMYNAHYVNQLYELVTRNAFELTGVPCPKSLAELPSVILCHVRGGMQ